MQVIAACNFVTATRLAITGYEYSTRGYYFVPWMKLWFFLQCLLPDPGVLLRPFWPRSLSPADLQRSGFFLCGIAVLMAVLGIALLFSWRWAFLAELAVCLLAVAGRFFALADLMKPANARPPNNFYSWLRAALVGVAYLAVIAFARVPRLRRYAGPVAAGVASHRQFYRHQLHGTLNPALVSSVVSGSILYLPQEGFRHLINLGPPRCTAF
ncbi:MAG TPA: hypothetical protein VJN89_23955 [Candidatus Acidoferrum sp.]|nr:hypothetical protein [Candidatus Acidoferrum sp.]